MARVFMTAVAFVVAILSSAAAQQVPERAIAEALGNVYRLSDYSVFDWVAARYDRGTLTLTGFTRTTRLKQQAGAAARKARGIEEIANEIEVLPSHGSDDDIRLAAFVAIYGSSSLEQYAPGGRLSGQSLQELEQSRLFGLDGVDVGRGPHGIHIVVSGARVLLLGTVRTTGDSQQANAKVRGLPGVIAVINQLRVQQRR